MDRSRQGPASLAYGRQTRLLVGSALVSFGILLAAGGGSWDITNHLLNKPETFFAPPHAILYSGVGLAVAGAAVLYLSSRHLRTMPWPAKLALSGVALLVIAGPVDLAWHSAFGLDGLFSPPHFVLVADMVASSLGGVAGMAYHSAGTDGRFRLHPGLVVLGVVPVWLAFSGIADLLTLPFSKTAFFDFDPDPTSAVFIATMAFPLIIAACLCAASHLSGRRFGAVSLVGAGFIAIGALSSIVPANSLHYTLPFYALGIIPIVAADAIMSYRLWRPFPVATFAAGAVVGIAFFMLYFPLITHTYNESVDPSRLVWPSVTGEIYFGLMLSTYPLLVGPAAAMGVVGAVVSAKLTAPKKFL